MPTNETDSAATVHRSQCQAQGDLHTVLYYGRVYTFALTCSSLFYCVLKHHVNKCAITLVHNKLGYCSLSITRKPCALLHIKAV